MSELNSHLIKMAASLTSGRHLGKIQVISEYQKTVTGRKLRALLEEVEENQRLDAIFLRNVFNYIVKLENKE